MIHWLKRSSSVRHNDENEISRLWLLFSFKSVFVKNGPLNTGTVDESDPLWSARTTKQNQLVKIALRIQKYFEKNTPSSTDN